MNEYAGMTNLDRLIAAEHVQGGVISDYDRRFKAQELSGKSFALMSIDEMAAHARKLMDAGLYDECRVVNRATIAHLRFSTPRTA